MTSTLFLRNKTDKLINDRDYCREMEIFHWNVSATKRHTNQMQSKCFSGEAKL